MKSIFILLLSLGSLVSQGKTPEDVNPLVVKSFENTFSNATDVDWTVSAAFVKVQFALDGQYINAFYHADGELFAITRNITSSQLPVMLRANLKKQTENMWISELFELTTEEGISYFVCLENADARVVLKSTDNKNWESFSKDRKI
jgi:hypothetical protein